MASDTAAGKDFGAEFTQVIVEEGAPDTAVDGLQELFETPVFNADPEAAGAVSGGGSVKIILETSQTDSDAEDRLEAAAKENGKQIGMTFDLKVKMIITSSGGTTKEKRITDTGEMLTVVLPLKDTVPENADITVLREHEGGISYLPELSGSERLSAEKEGFYIQDMRIFLRVHRFSAYSLLYSERTGDGTGDDTEVIDRNVPGTWVSIFDGGWQYRLTDGSYAKNRWCFIGNVWYYFNKDSRMQTGWIREPEDIWYYLDPLTGAMRTGMLTAPDGHRYYFYGNGMMAAGDVYHNGKLLKFNSVRPSVPTYDLSADGSWVKNDYMTELPYGAELEEQA